MRRPLIIGLSALAGILVIVSLTYRRYAYARVWHHMHGDNATLAGHQVTLPYFWWAESVGPDGATVLTRAYPTTSTSLVEISANMLMAGTIPSSDQNAIQIQQNLTKRTKHQSADIQTSAVTLHSKSLVLYCRRDDVLKVQRTLICIVPKVPYSFVYVGTQDWEGEAESILSSLN